MAILHRPTRIPVFLSRHSKIPFRWIKPHLAIDCLLRGRAELCGPGIICKPKPNVAESAYFLDGAREGIYELAAIDKNRRYVGGGLTRDEHCPAPFNRFKGARVGHEP